MNWNDRRRDEALDRDVLRRIVALLRSLAGLAECAAGVSGRRRRGEVLGILLWGEAAARVFLIETATGSMVLGAPVPPGHYVAPGDVPASVSDAGALAVRLRALALVLCVVLAGAHAGATASRFARQNAVAPTRTGQPSALLPAPDTS